MNFWKQRGENIYEEKDKTAPGSGNGVCDDVEFFWDDSAGLCRDGGHRADGRGFVSE